jgi:hypothetical protein
MPQIVRPLSSGANRSARVFTAPGDQQSQGTSHQNGLQCRCPGCPPPGETPSRHTPAPDTYSRPPSVRGPFGKGELGEI